MGVLLVGGVVLACNVLSGARDLGTCEGAPCEATTGEPGGGTDAHATISGDIPTDGSGSSGGSSSGGSSSGDVDDAGPEEPVSDAGSTGPDGSPACSTMCDGSACCAPNTCVIATGICGACSGSEGPCQVDADCCSGLVCSGRGRCVKSCTQKGGICFLGGCCAGSRCSLASICVACGVHGSSCSGATDCCSGNCTSGKCVGTTAAGGG